MFLTFLRGACVIIETSHKRILCDPWLEDGAYYGAWAHYPPFPESDYAKYGLDSIDYIYVSHIHPDHFDPKTMAKINNKPPVLIHSYPSKFLKKRIEALDYEVIELEHGKTFDMGSSVSLRVFSADDCDPTACGAFFGCAMPGVRNTQVDSMAVVRDGRRTLVNVNDCPYALSRGLAEKIGQEYDVDLALIAYGGAGPYPQCFDIPLEKKHAAALRKQSQFIDGVVGFARALRARRVFPFAGDYQLCGPLSALNELRGIPEIAEVYSRLRANGIHTLALNPGGGAAVTSPGGHLFSSEQSRELYVQETLSKCLLDYQADDVAVPSKEELYELCQAAWKRFNAKRLEYGMHAKATAYFDLGDGWFFVAPPSGDPVLHYGAFLDTHYVRISTDPRLFKMLLQGPQYAHWNNAEIGSHLRFSRSPDIYEPGLYHLLSFFHA